MAVFCKEEAMVVVEYFRLKENHTINFDVKIEEL